jgi:hypothetical protein
MERSRRGFRVSFIAVITLLLIGSLAASEKIDIGYRDFSYPLDTGSNSRPTGEKPESKLWFNEGAWWGVLWSTPGKAYRIHRLDRTTQDWLDTGTAVDDRLKSRVDVGWDGTKLYVASHIYTGTGAPVMKESDRGRLYRFSYDAGTDTYTLDGGFPVLVTRGKSETLVLAKDSTGQLWVTYVENNQVMVNHSVNGDDRTWATPFVLTGANANTLDKDDIASIIAYDGHVGIMWSRQTYNNLSQPTPRSPRSRREVQRALRTPVHGDRGRARDRRFAGDGRQRHSLRRRRVTSGLFESTSPARRWWNNAPLKRAEWTFSVGVVTTTVVKSTL